MIFKRKNCSNCKIGMESYKLDMHSDMCPYLISFKKNKCRFYEPLEKEEKFFVRKIKNAIFKAKK